MAYDVKKECKELYAPKKGPSIVEVPPMSFVAVRGSGDPNEENGAYQRAIAILYAISYTIKMSKKGVRRIDGYVDFVVPPLEGFWWQDGVEGADYAHKEAFHWIAVIRLPGFVTREVFDWAVQATTANRPRSRPWTLTRGRRAMSSTCRRRGVITRSTCRTPAGLPPTS